MKHTCANDAGCAACRCEGYDMARYRVIKMLDEHRYVRHTIIVKNMFTGLIRHVGLALATYAGDIPVELPRWVLGKKK